MKPGSFTGNVVILTGASRGIGEELAVQLAAQGAKLALAARNAARLETVAERCRALGGEALSVPMDVSQREQCRVFVEKTVEAYGGMDTLIDNARITMWVKFEEVTDLSIYEKIMQVNYLGSVYCTYFTLPYLKQTHGRIVAVSSPAGKAAARSRPRAAATRRASPPRHGVLLRHPARRAGALRDQRDCDLPGLRRHTRARAGVRTGWQSGRSWRGSEQPYFKFPPVLSAPKIRCSPFITAKAVFLVISL